MAKDSIKKKDQLGIVLENFNDKFGLAMEGFSVLTKEVNGLKGEFKKLDKKVDGLSKQLDDFKVETNSKFETVFNYLSNNDDMMHQLVGRTNNLEQRIYVLETKIIN